MPCEQSDALLAVVVVLPAVQLVQGSNAEQRVVSALFWQRDAELWFGHDQFYYDALFTQLFKNDLLYLQRELR